MRIDYKRFRGVEGETESRELAREIVREHDADDPPSLTGAILNDHQGGTFIQEELDRQQREAYKYNEKPLQWRILVVRDEFGEAPQPGDIVSRPMPINREKADPDDMSAARRDGTFEEKYIRKNDYLVDEKGCIQCPYADASYFLMNYGMDFRTRKGICRKREVSVEPRKLRDGSYKHIWYWRFAEVPAGEYAKLPERKQEDEEKTKKRGK